ncbi:alpha/beta hydrolase [Methylocystis sp. SB2]|uniref:alpha/beta hydrolase n=1 Tax=Methylocystis sp. (strain SB2) TaxID=743836 RepID=UPI001EFA2D7E|nr:alpha/beta fold hydrolase [Methylocystis sp. SB2]ULO25309.1 alpha/beta fold hydrolase [Methylocystis sp. SB2]
MKKMRSIFFALIATGAVTLSLGGLSESEAGLVIQRLHIGETPVTVMRKSDSPPAPAIVIAHGFSGSQQLMAPIARTLARNNYVAVTFDFSGHGRNPRPMPGGLAKLETSTAALLKDIDEVVRFAQRQPWADGRVALVGHSMATDLVVRHAISDPQIAAVAAFSFFGEGVTRDQPKNLIIIDGAWESQRLIEAGVRVVSQAAGGTAQAGVTYGDIARGTGRRLAIARGVEHIGVLYSRDAMTETLNWVNAAFGRSESGYIDARGPWLALLFAGLIALMRPLAQFLPQVSPVPLGAGLPWRRLAPIAIAPALLTPLILWKAPTDFLPILLGDYLVAHLAVYGVLIFAGLWLAQGGLPVFRPPRWKPLLIAAVALAALHARSRPAARRLCHLLPADGRSRAACPNNVYRLRALFSRRRMDDARPGRRARRLCLQQVLLHRLTCDRGGAESKAAVLSRHYRHRHRHSVDGLWAGGEMGLCAHARSARLGARRSLRPRLGAGRHVPDRRLSLARLPSKREIGEMREEGHGETCGDRQRRRAREGAAQRDEQSRPSQEIAEKAGWRRPAPGECLQTKNADGFERHEDQDPVDELRVYHEGAHARSAGRLALGQ